jgi:prepilin-type N-terminal cleavage/methylation domain-containing protein
MKISNFSKGFTLIELVVTITIIAVLSGIVLFGVTQYINKGKDASISGNLVVLIPAGEVYYNGHNGSYAGFCSTNVVANAKNQMPKNTVGKCYSVSNISGVCCNDVTPNNDAWAACATEFTNSSNAYCVDSRGVKKEISNSSCSNLITQCP